MTFQGSTADGDETAGEQPLAGLRVVDLTRALSGPYATLLLAGLGAEVVKLEEPVHGDLARDNSPYVGRDGVVVERRHEDDLSVSHLSRARGKYGIAVDLKQPAGRDVFFDLVATSDVVVENFTAGTADRLGIGYGAAAEVNRGIVYCSLSGFGAGASQGAKAMDILIQAMSGAMYASGAEGEPPVRLGLPVADLLAPVFGVIGILAALQQRERTGRGQHVDVSMLGALTSFVAVENWRAMELAGMTLRTGPTLQRLCPFGVFPCRDGHVALVAVHDPLANGLFRAMGRPELGQDARFATRDARVANASELEDLIAAWSSDRDVAETVAALEAERVPAAPVRTPIDAVAAPEVVARGETDPLVHPVHGAREDLRTAGVPIRFSDASTGFAPMFPTRVGEHTADVLKRLLGYDDERLASLRSQGAIGQADTAE
ncbi:CaiB/BaiF CoA transferase family protein [Egicoccus sp. AB-alg2]|uniref:CaiB/BaiF CoA transferase family protein n=1 Tax=Egicoccus sp. AB-alg2 TaxID=3242693 RepID=UPI00359D2DB9